MTTLLFELEGVLVETLPLRAAALSAALAEDGIQLDPEEALEHSRGRAVRRAVAAAAHEARISYDIVAVDLAASRAERIFAGHAAAGGVMLAAGAVELVQRAQASARCALVARATRAEVDLLLRLAGLEDAFESIVSLDDVVEEKPAPAAYRAMLAKLERRRPVPRRTAIALEDGGDGARAARTAGIVSIVVGAAPASDALEADGYLPSLAGATMDTIRSIAARAGANVL